MKAERGLFLAIKHHPRLTALVCPVVVLASPKVVTGRRLVEVKVDLASLPISRIKRTSTYTPQVLSLSLSLSLSLRQLLDRCVNRGGALQR